MTKTSAERELERKRAEAAERTRLMALTEAQAWKEGSDVWYTRMRYFREIEAAEWVEQVQKELPKQKPVIQRDSAHDRQSNYAKPVASIASMWKK